MKSLSLPKPLSEEALFRYHLVSQVLSLLYRGQSRSQAIRYVLSQVHVTMSGYPRRVSERTLHRWVAAFDQDGLPGLERQSRVLTDGSLVISEDVLSYCKIQKEQDPRCSIPELIKRARELGLIKPSQHVDRTTLYRALKRRGVRLKRRKKQPSSDKRRYAYDSRMHLVLCDGKHFRAGVGRQKRVAFFYLDDATRYGLSVVVGTAETSVLFLQGLYKMVQQYGLPTLIYLDHGPGFIAHDTIQVVEQLGFILVHGAVAYPQGHGKIERFNQTVRNALLRGLDRRPDVDSNCSALQLRLNHWLTTVYNQTPHEALHKQSPADRFHHDPKPLRFPSSIKNMEHCFMVPLQRTVSNDNAVSVDSIDYDLPTGYDGTKITLYKHVLSDTVHFIHQDHMIELHPVDLSFNARNKRGQQQSGEETITPLSLSAADEAYNRDYKSIVGPDGGFSDPVTKEHTTSKEEYDD